MSLKVGTREVVATFSIVALDPDTGELGVAVQSKFLAVGAVVPWARAGVGAVATQAVANVSYGPRGLEMMQGGKNAQETVELLTKEDAGREHRQVGIVDGSGRAATFTGGECFDWTGGVTGEHYAAQGNILVSGETVSEMARVFEASDGLLADRLLGALDAGQEAGGDSRGRQSAALLVVRQGGGYGGESDRIVDLRVDDHPEPIRELIRLRGLHELYFGETRPEDVLAIDEAREEVEASLLRLGYLKSRNLEDEALYDALRVFVGTENFEERDPGRGYLDRVVLDFMKNKAQTKA